MKINSVRCADCGSTEGRILKEGLYFTFCCYDCENPEEVAGLENGPPNEQLELPLNDEPKWLKEAKKVAELVQQKQEAYGDSFGKSGRVMRELFPNGISPEQMDDALTIVRVLDKLFRIATKKDAFGESPWKDINGYSLLALTRDEEQKKR